MEMERGVGWVTMGLYIWIDWSGLLAIKSGRFLFIKKSPQRFKPALTRVTSMNDFVCSKFTDWVEPQTSGIPNREDPTLKGRAFRVIGSIAPDNATRISSFTGPSCPRVRTCWWGRNDQNGTTGGLDDDYAFVRPTVFWFSLVSFLFCEIRRLMEDGD